jgi:predicted methyltransferase
VSYLETNVLVTIAENVSLREGSEGVKNFFRIVFQNEGISTRGCAKKLKMPIPIVAAIKQEAIKADLIEPGSTLRLTDKGAKFCKDELKLSKYQENICVNCKGLKYIIPTEYEPILEKIKLILDERPKVDVTIDQAHGTPKTALRRAILALEKGVLFEKRIAFLGDDDYVSVAVMLLHQHLFSDQQLQLVVFDLDQRILDHIKEVSKKFEYEIETVKYDVRDNLLEQYKFSFDAVFTDPPYTEKGAKIFLQRAQELLKDELGKNIFFSFGHKAPKEMIKVQRLILDFGFSISEMIPNFNEYLGAAILGNLGQMSVLERAELSTSKDINIEDNIYTNKK